MALEGATLDQVMQRFLSCEPDRYLPLDVEQVISLAQRKNAISAVVRVVLPDVAWMKPMLQKFFKIVANVK